MQRLLKDKTVKFLDWIKLYLSRSRRGRKLLLILIPIVWITGFAADYFTYANILHKTKIFFKTQFEEKVESNILMAASWFKNYTNSLAYEIKTQFSYLPPGIDMNYYLTKRSKFIRDRYQGVIKEVIFVNFRTGTCEFILPEKKRGIYRHLYRIIDHSSLNIKKSLAKNFIYVFIPNTETEKVDSTIWGLISQTVRIKGKIVGKIFFAIDVANIISKRVTLGSNGEDVYKMYLLPLKTKRESLNGKFTSYVRWDNSYLLLKFRKNPSSEIPWITRYKTVKNYLLFFSIAIGFFGFLTFSFAILFIVNVGAQQEKEMEELYKQSEILNNITENLKEKMQNSTPEEMVVSGLKTLMENKNVQGSVIKGDELIFTVNGSEEPEGECLTTYSKDLRQFCREIKIGRDAFKIYLKFIHSINEKEFIFYSLLLDIIGFAANFSNEYRVRRSIESNTFKSILKLLGAKDHYTCDHSVSVSAIAEFIAREIGMEKFGLTEYDIEVIKMAGYLHDIGKMGIPDEILNKLGRYIEPEMEIMKLHPKYTELIIMPLAEYVDFYKDVLEVAVHHHERLDGSGYPYGLKGKEFTIQMQILAISDILDAMMRDRPYKRAKTDKEVISELKKMVSGPQEKWKFNPVLVNAVIMKFKEIKQIPDKIDKDFCEIDID